MGISRDSSHKRRLTGGRLKRIRMKRKFELGRQPASTKIGDKKVTKVRVRGGHYKFRALRLDHGNFTWPGEAVTRKTRILGVVYNATSNELVRTNTLVKGCIVQIDGTPYKQWYIKYYNVELGKKKAVEGDAEKKTEEKGDATQKKGEEGAKKDAQKKGDASKKDASQKKGDAAKKGDATQKKGDATQKKGDANQKKGDDAKKGDATQKKGGEGQKKGDATQKKDATKKGDAAKKDASKKKGDAAKDTTKKEEKAEKKKKRRDITYTVRDEEKLHPETKAKLVERNKTRELEQALADQFRTGRLYAKITSRPGQSGRADGYILEGDELAFYLKKIFAKKSKNK